MEIGNRLQNMVSSDRQIDPFDIETILTITNLVVNISSVGVAAYAAGLFKRNKREERGPSEAQKNLARKLVFLREELLKVRSCLRDAVLIVDRHANENKEQAIMYNKSNLSGTAMTLGEREYWAWIANEEKIRSIRNRAEDVIDEIRSETYNLSYELSEPIEKDKFLKPFDHLLAVLGVNTYADTVDQLRNCIDKLADELTCWSKSLLNVQNNQRQG